MGQYTTSTSLAVVMIGTTFDTLTTSMATTSINWAESEVNKYLSKRYDVSSFATTVPPLVRTLAEWLSIAYVYQNNARGGKESRERAKEYRDMALDNLKLIADYKLDLLDTSGSVITDFSNTAYRVMSSTVNYHDTFAEDSELNWSVDSDKLNDIGDERE